MSKELFEIRDASGHVFNTVSNPAIVVDIEAGVMFKIGEYDDMEKYFRETTNTYFDKGFDEMGQAIALMNLPKNQSEIDKFFQICDYSKTFYNKMIKAELNTKYQGRA